MKNPRMMMGLVALLLAGAGAFASISQPQQTAYYEQIVGQPSSCTQFLEPVPCEPGEPSCQREISPGELRQLYGDTGCTQELQQESGF